MPDDWSDIEVIGGPNFKEPAAPYVRPPRIDAPLGLLNPLPVLPQEEEPTLGKLAPLPTMSQAEVDKLNLPKPVEETPLGRLKPLPAMTQAESDKILEETKGGPVAPIGRLFGRLGRGVKDILGAYAFEAIRDPELQAKQLGISAEAIKKAGFKDVEPDPDIPTTPLQQGLERLPTVPRVISEAPYALAEQTPRLAAVAGLQAMGVPAPAGAAAVFGTTEEGFDPKSAAIAAFLPFAGKYAGELGGVIAKKFGVDSTTAINIIKGGTATVAPSAALVAEQEREISHLPKDQQHEARLNMWANILGQAALGPMGAKYEKGKPNAMESKTAPAVRTVREAPGEGVREVSEEGGRKTNGERGGVEERPQAQASPQQIADELGARFEYEGNGRWIFTAFDSEGKESTTFGTKANATPEEVSAAYEATRTRYEGEPDQPRPLKPKPPLLDMEQAGKMTGEQLVEELKKSGKQATQAGYELALKTTTLSQRNRIAELSAQADEETAAALEKISQPKKPNETDEEYAARRDAAFTEAQNSNAKKQFFDEAGRLYDAIQEARQTGDTAAAAKKFGVDEPYILKGGGKRATGEKATQKEGQPVLNEQGEKVYDLSEAEKELRTKPEYEYSPAIRDASGKVTQGSSHDELRRQGITGTPGFVDRDGNFLTMLDVARQKQAQAAMPAGPGAATPEDVGAKSNLASLLDSVRTLAAQGKKPQLQKAYTLGERLDRWKDAASNAIEGLKAAGKYGVEFLRNPPTWNSFKAALGKRQLALSESAMTIQEFKDKALRAVPDALTREAISNWVDNGGDRAAILRAMAETDPKYEPGYQKALSLSGDELTVARNIQNYFESRLQEAIDAGILEDGIENYIHRIYPKDSNWKGGVLAELRSGIFTGKPSLAKQRVFRYDWEAEKAGYKPVKDFVERVAQYDFALNKAIADRQFVREMMEWRLPDGKPAIGVGGIGQKVGGVGADAAFLVKPNFRGDKLATDDGRPYIPFDHPALRKWKWVEEDANGSPIMVQGDVFVHPDALKEVKAVFGKSLLRQYALGRGALNVSSTAKQTMLDLSGFHPAQITIHGLEHRANVPLGRWSAAITGRDFKPIDLTDPLQRALVSHGVTVIDYNAHQLFSEGVSGGGSSLFRHIPGLGPKLAQYNHWLFSDFIPRLKMDMAQKAYYRNKEAYAKDLASGKMTEDQLLHLTANEANAAFGELNYEMMGRNRTFQDVLRLGLLAPDFLEARARFAGQAGKTLVGGYGREQLVALGLGAVTMYTLARILNKMIDGQYHFEPEHLFDVVHNGRAYSVRTVQGDIIHAAFNPRSFAYTRLNPVTTRTIFEATTGRDQFGRPRSAAEQVKDFASTLVPISARGLFRGREQKVWESFINAFGATERRATASDTIYKMVDKFKKQHNISEPGEFIYDPEKDPYRGIKLALMFDKPETAAQEMKLALSTGKTDWQHLANYFDNFGKRPFTGSKQNEKLFWNSLSEDQKKTYERALEERKKMRQNAAQAFKLYRQDLNKQP